MRFPASLFHYSRYEPAFAAELLSIGARTSQPGLSIVIAILLVVITHQKLSHAAMAIWLGGALALTLFGYWVKARYSNRSAPPMTRTDLRNAEWTGILYAATVGGFWGSSSQLMLPDEPTHNLIIMMTFFGVSAGASTISVFSPARHIIAFLLFITTFVLPMPRMFPGEWHWLVFMFVLYGIVILRSALERCDIMVSNLQLRREKDQLLQQQRLETAKAVKANQDKSAFLAAASHDLRQPLHALMLTSHALSLQTPEGEARALVGRMLKAGNTLSEQFNHLMDLSRLESGTYQVSIAGVSVPALIQQAVASHAQVAESRGLHLRARIDRRLHNSVFNTDAGLLKRILGNFIDNAIKFSEPGKSILVSARLRAGALLFAVHDQGIGVPEVQRDNIFKPYVQLNNPTRELNRGIGLGLSVVQEAAQLIGGKLSLHSRPGRGSCFALSLPAGLSRSLRLPVASDPLPQSGRLQGKRLLLVEDDSMAAGALIAWSHNLKLQIEHYTDPRAVPEDLRPDLILCDIRLPGERDGIDWLTDWLTLWPEARGLLLSGEITADTHARAEQEGLLLLSKPIKPDLLLQTLVSLV